jgi:PAS domain S-box-containing protein
MTSVDSTQRENAIIAQKTPASLEADEKAACTLREMQVCSLNIMEDLQKKNRDLAMLTKTSQEITRCTSLPELARVATEAVSAAFDGAHVSLYLMDAKLPAFAPFHTTGELSGDVENLQVDATGDLATRLAGATDMVIDSTGDCAEFPLAKCAGAKSSLIVPLRFNSTMLGFMAVCETRWHRVFIDEERENLRVLASTLSVAIENVALISRTAAQVEEMNALTEYVETVVDSVDLAIMVIGADLKIGMINKGYERIYNTSREPFIGMHIFEAYPYLVEQGFENIMREVLAGKPFVRYGWKRKVLGGRELVQNMRIFPHRSADGNVVGAVVIIEDVTEKAELERQLARSEAKFQGLVEDLGDCYFIVTQGKIVYANKAASQLTGRSASNILGMGMDRLISDSEMIARCSEPGGKKKRHECRLIHNTGTWIPVEISFNPCDYGGNESVSVVVRDVTERKKFEKQLELKNREMTTRNEQITRLNLELEATVNKLKESQENLVQSERLAAITETSVAANHEINNPLFAILGQAQLLLRKYADENEDTAQRLKTIEESAFRIACVTKKLANLVEPVVKEYAGLSTSMIDVDNSTTR